MMNKKNLWIFDLCAALLIFLLVCLLKIYAGRIMYEPDSWAYNFAAENFGKGRIVVDGRIHQQQSARAEKEGGNLIHYLKFNHETWEDHKWEGMWYFEKAPGYPLLLSGWQQYNLEEVFPVFLGLATTLVLFWAGRTLFAGPNPIKTPGFLLNLFFWANTLILIMFSRTYMPSFTSTALITISLALLLINQRHKKPSSPEAKIVLLLSGAAMGLAISVRYTNLLIGVIVLIYLCIQNRKNLLSLVFWLTPITWSIFCLSIYNTYLFGNPFDYGYKFSPFNIKTALNYVITSPKHMNYIIDQNASEMPFLVFAGLPVTFLAAAWLIFNKWQNRNKTPKNTNILKKPEIILMCAIIIAISLAYLGYEWTALNREAVNGTIRVAMLARFYLPIVFPAAVIAVNLFQKTDKFIKTVALSIVIPFTILSFIQFVQAIKLGRTQNRPSQEELLIPPNRRYLLENHKDNLD